ncbi:MAG: hypothetical protein AB7H88_21425 [Vicinamibacterales bacterium]
MKTTALLVPILIGASVTGFAQQTAAPPPQAPTAAGLVAEQTYPFTYTATELGGPGGDLLRRETADSQFVLFGEDHLDHEIPIFAGALFSMLHQAHGFRHLVVEQDPVAIEDALEPGLRGDVERIAARAARYPSLYEFDSDEDLTLVADVGRLLGTPEAIWGVEQATGAARYLEELVTLAPGADVRRQAEALLAEARAADPGPNYSVNWLATVSTEGKVAALSAAFAAAPGSRAARLLDGLVKSAEIFGYYTRGEAGEFVGLYNNTVREEVLKANFLQRYHAAARTDPMPKAMFKFGAYHMYHGKSPTQAFPIGNLAHELAIVNGRRAYGVMVQQLGEGYVSYKDLPAWLLPLLPAAEPTVPTLVNLRELRRFQRLFSEGVDPGSRWLQRAVLHGFDAIVLLPNSRPSVKTLGGRGTPAPPR